MYRKLGIDVNMFYLKRNANIDTPQLKNDSETLRELGIVTGSILHVTLGTPLAADEYLLKVVLSSGGMCAIHTRCVFVSSKSASSGAEALWQIMIAPPAVLACGQGYPYTLLPPLRI